MLPKFSPNVPELPVDRGNESAQMYQSVETGRLGGGGMSGIRSEGRCGDVSASSSKGRQRLGLIVLSIATLALVGGCGLMRGTNVVADACSQMTGKSIQSLRFTVRTILNGEPESRNRLHEAEQAIRGTTALLGSVADRAAESLARLAMEPRTPSSMDEFVSAINAFGEEVQDQCDLPLN